MNRCIALLVLTLALTCVPTRALQAEATGVDPAKAKAGVQQGVNFLKTTQSEDGSWTTATQPGIGGLVVFALLESGVPADDPVVARGLKYLESFIQPDGGIYHPETTHKNYETSITLLAFQAANKDGRYTQTIEAAMKSLKSLQWGTDGKVDSTNAAFGGAGYGRSQRPDLSNTQFFLEALTTAGVSPDDPAMKNALVFVSRCQNLEGENNNTPFAALVNDGGFYYTPAAGGSSMAGKTPEGGLRSYASMTYAGLKSMIYAGLAKDDPRVRAATDWIRKFYTITENPGMGEQGLFYYYHTFAKTLDVMNIDEFEDANGVKHDWRKELGEHLINIQKQNGSWVNDADRWMEGDPNLVTAYALLAMRYVTK